MHGVNAFTADEGAYAFQALLCHDRAYSGYATMTGTPWFAAYAQRSRFAEMFRSKRQSSTDASELLAELHALPPEEWPTRLRRLVSDAGQPDSASHHRSGSPALRIRP